MNTNRGFIVDEETLKVVKDKLITEPQINEFIAASNGSEFVSNSTIAYWKEFAEFCSGLVETYWN